MSIRTRLLLGMVGVVSVGFIALSVIAGAQISSAARADYEFRLENEIRLIAQGIGSELRQGDLDSDGYDALIALYEGQINGTIRLFQMPQQERGEPPRESFREYPEIETAMRDDVVVVERPDEAGQPALFTADKIESRPPIIVQLSVPLANLQAVINGRWILIWALFGGVLIAALLASLLVARSIIRPLFALRDSAHRLSTGDFSTRVAYARSDEIGEVARAFNEMAHQVESMLEEQRAFVASTSHELRTPLTTIRLRSEALRDEDALDDVTAKQYIAEIDDEARRMGTLIEDLTVLARFDAGRAELGSESIDFALFVESLRRRMQPAADAKRIRLDLRIEPELPVVRASLTHLTVVFRNLLDNAIKYTPDEGVIYWVVYPRRGGVSSTITDTGRGIETDDLARVFERFYRVDRARSRDIPGSGLGLAIVKSILDAYGATINIESAGKDRGTTVQIWWKGEINGL